LIAGVMLGLQMVGVGLGFFAVFAGAIGLGIGFGSQALAANFISGLILQFGGPIKLGDMVEVDGILGQVLRINSTSTVVRTPDNISVIVPNSAFIGNNVINWTEGERRMRVRVEVGVAYGSDVNLVTRLLLKAAREQSRIADHPIPSVRFEAFGESSLDFVIMGWIHEPSEWLDIRSELRYAIDRLFRENGVEIPFPQRDLHLRSSEATIRLVREKGWDIEEPAEDGPAEEG
ncbi:MAG: mechanosensitive ion channel, partial [Myxococcales bacterium]|nr:mechanosensitive ion channel [Myxococcales bacterium]